MSTISRKIKATTITFADTFFDEAGEPKTDKKTLVVAGKIADKKKAAAYLTKHCGTEHSFLVLSVTESEEKYEMDLDEFLTAAHKVTDDEEPAFSASEF